MLWFGAGKPAVSGDEKKIDELLTRGVEKVIPRELGLKKLRSGERLRVYLGIDPTGAKLHLGHSVPLRKLKQFSDLGHEVVFLVGSFTAMIGDPSGRDALREPLTAKQVRENFKDYQRQAGKILDFKNIEVRYNDEWLSPMTLSRLVELASHFTVQQLLQRDMFEKRLKEGKPIALHEFLYPVMVGYDSVMLDVDCELGGSDQEFNVLAGRHLQERLGKREKFVLTTKLIEGTDGRKMSKSYDNCVYLEDAPNDMYGKLMSVRDELVRTYFEICTDVATDEVERIIGGHPKEAKMRLAREIVSMYHSAEAAQKAEEDFNKTYSKGGTPENTIKIFLSETIKISDQLVLDKIVPSKSELRRLEAAGAIEEVGGEKILQLDTIDVGEKKILRIGKHRFVELLKRKN